MLPITAPSALTAPSIRAEHAYQIQSRIACHKLRPLAQVAHRDTIFLHLGSAQLAPRTASSALQIINATRASLGITSMGFRVLSVSLGARNARIITLARDALMGIITIEGRVRDARMKFAGVLSVNW